MIVADTNLATYRVTSGPHTASAERVRTRDCDWIAPELMRIELLNVVAQQMRMNLVDLDTALRTYRRGLSMVKIQKWSSDPLTQLNLCSAWGCSLFHLKFVSLAIHLGAPLVRADNAVLRAFRTLASSLDGFSVGNS